MNTDYSVVYEAVGTAGFLDCIKYVPPTLVHTLLTGTNDIDRARSAGPGRAASGIWHLYLSPDLMTISGEAIKGVPTPQKHVVRDAKVSGKFFHIDDLPHPEFQKEWRRVTGENPHLYSQGFTTFLKDHGIGSGHIAGLAWRSVQEGLTGINYMVLDSDAIRDEGSSRFPGV